MNRGSATFRAVIDHLQTLGLIAVMEEHIYGDYESIVVQWTTQEPIFHVVVSIDPKNYLSITEYDLPTHDMWMGTPFFCVDLAHPDAIELLDKYVREAVW